MPSNRYASTLSAQYLPLSNFSNFGSSHAMCFKWPVEFGSGQRCSHNLHANIDDNIAVKTKEKNF